MAIKKRTDQLPAILSGDVDNNDLMYLVHENAQAETGYDSKKILVSDVGRKLNNKVEYVSELPSFPSGSQNPLDALELLKQEILDLYPVNSASGSIANFTTSLALPLVALKAYIQAQGGGGTPSAPVAITGWSALNLYQRGKNLAHFTNSGTSGSGVVSYTINKSEFTINSTLSSSYGYRFGDDAKILLKKGTYYLSSNIANQPNNSGVFVYNTDTTTILARARAEQGGSFTLSQDTFISIGLSLSTSTATGTFTFQIEAGSTKTDYEAYNGTEYTIQLGQTCYGGYIDKNTGKLVVINGIITFDGSIDELWVYYSNNDGFYLSIDDMQSGQNLNGLCSHFPIETAFSRFGVRLGNNNTRVYFNQIPSNISGVTSDVDTWRTWLSNNPVTLVYPLATPIETDITIPDITALVGENNIFADSGDIEVSFKQGIQEYIDAKIAETQALIL